MQNGEIVEQRRAHVTGNSLCGGGTFVARVRFDLGPKSVYYVWSAFNEDGEQLRYQSNSLWLGEHSLSVDEAFARALEHALENVRRARIDRVYCFNPLEAVWVTGEKPEPSGKGWASGVRRTT